MPIQCTSVCQVSPAADGVDVGIDQARNDGAAAEIDDAGGGAGVARISAVAPIAAIFPLRTARACAGAES